MEIPRIRIVSDNDIQTIELHDFRDDRSVVDTVKHSNNRVYQDRSYKIFVENIDADNPNFAFSINNEILSRVIGEKGSVVLGAEYGNALFSQSYGFIQMQVSYEKSGQKYIFESSYIPVMVKKGIKNDSIKRMTEYIYANNALLLTTENSIPIIEDNDRKIDQKTLEAKLFLLKKILGVLETNYHYFKINSRYKTIHAEKTDYFDKLQYVSVSTIQYIAQHPDELRRTNTNTGIVINGHRYQPERTLITQNMISYDTEENRSIIAFVDRLCFDIQKLYKDITTLLLDNDYDLYDDGEYISSAYYVYMSTIDVLSKTQRQVKEYEKRALSIKNAYHDIYKISSSPLRVLPNPSAIFLSVPQYRQVYECMVEWLKKANVGLQLHDQILGLKRISDIYELYVLLKLINYMYENDYKLIERTRNVYTFPRRSLYKNTAHNNTFVFEKEKTRITLYYQPVIYNSNKSNTYGLGLYRNNSISFNYNTTDTYYSGEYYTPDYIFKLEDLDNDSDQYLILDAKYTSLLRVMRFEVPDLSFKYLFSISPIERKNRLVGMYIINGQSDSSDDGLTNVYDNTLEEGSIMPRAEVITMTENSENNTETHINILNSSIGRFIT